MKLLNAVFPQEQTSRVSVQVETRKPSLMFSLTNCVVPKRYNASLVLDHEKANFRGVLKVELEPRQGAKELSEFSLHGENLIVLSAHIGNLKFTVKYDRPGKAITFSTDKPIDVSNGQRVEPLILEYIGKINAIKTYKDVTRGIFKTNYMDSETGSSDNYVIATHSQPGFARMILPCIDEVNHKAQFQLDITAHERFQIVSNTAAVSEERIPESQQKRVFFDTTPLMTPSLLAFVLGDLRSIESKVALPQGELPVRFLAAQQVELAAFGLDTVCKYLPALQEMFKLSFPIAKLDFALLPFLSDMAMENFGLITIQQDNVLLGPTNLADASVQSRVEQLLVHELVHQWMGNYISFDSWDHLWFNEAFATWCACEVLSNVKGPDYFASDDYLLQLESCLKRDSIPEGRSISDTCKSDHVAQTADAVDPQNYAKGISLIRSLQCSVGKENFKLALQEFTSDEKFHNRSIKPSEIWTFFGKKLRSENIPNYMFSWVHTPSFPILHVTQESGKTTLQQHRVKSAPDQQFEDVPYHIPLFTRLPDGSLDKNHALLTDRTLSLDYPVVSFNSNVQGYYRVSYESASCYEQIAQAISSGALSELDLYGIMRDLNDFIGNEIYQNKEHLDGLIHIISKTVPKIDNETLSKYYLGWSMGLKILEQLDLSVMRFASSGKDLDLEKLIIAPFFKRIDWPESFHGSKRDAYEIDVMAQVLSLGKKLPEVQALCAKYFKKVLQGPKAAIPFELVGSIFTVVSFQNTNLKQWKKHFELAKSSQGIAPHVTGCSPADLQTVALETIGFSTSLELVQKALNFVLTNISLGGSEKALFGMSYNAKEKCGNQCVRDVVWEWFIQHYDQWARKSLSGGSQESGKIKSTLMALSVIVFEMWLDTPEKIDTFTVMKQSAFGTTLGVSEIWASVKDSQLSKMKIYQGLLGF